MVEGCAERFEQRVVGLADEGGDPAHRPPAYARPVPDPGLFELPFDPVWDLDERYFLDVEHRYTKSHSWCGRSRAT